MPKVSVIIPTYNRSVMLRSAIDSVLAQTYQDFEIVVVNDCSRDDAGAVVASIADNRLKYICHETNKGVSAARNTGFLYSTGEYIAFLDDDDRWLPEKLQLQVDLLEKSSSSVGGVYTGFFKMDLGSGKMFEEVMPVKRGRILEDLYSRNWIGTASTVVVRRSCLEEAGLFDEGIEYGEEYDMWIRIAEKREFEFISKPLVLYFVHRSSLTSNWDKTKSGLESLLSKYGKDFATDKKSHSHRYLSLGVSYCCIKDLKRGRRAFLEAIRIYPAEVRNYYNLLLSLLGAKYFILVKDLKEHTRYNGKPSEEKDLNRRPKLLFLACPFPPCQAIGGVRAWNIAKYLTRMGWDVTVVTPHPSLWQSANDSEQVEKPVEGEGIRRVLTGHRWPQLCAHELSCWKSGLGWFFGGLLRKTARFLSIDSGIGWVGPAEQACSNLTPKDVDVILATGPPFASFRLAGRLAKKLGRPYVLDYRDPWTDNPHAPSPSRSSVFREEVSLLKACAAVTVVSSSWACAMDRRFKLGSKLNVVTNGYDPEDLAQVKPLDFGHRAIVYTGGFYPPKRSIAPLMAALTRIKDTGDDSLGEWCFHYYGMDGSHVLEAAHQFEVSDKLRLHGQVPRSEVLSAIKGAQVAVVVASVLKSTSLADRGIVPAKVYEALGLGTPVLLVAPPGSDARTVAESTGMAGSFKGDDIDGMASFLLDSMRMGSLATKNHEPYSWTNISKELDRILRDAARMSIGNSIELSLERSPVRVE